VVVSQSTMISPLLRLGLKVEGFVLVGVIVAMISSL
jgi:hypothetical protein